MRDPGQQPGVERALDRSFDEAVRTDDRGQQPFELLGRGLANGIGIVAERPAFRRSGATSASRTHR